MNTHFIQCTDAYTTYTLSSQFIFSTMLYFLSYQQEGANALHHTET